MKTQRRTNVIKATGKTICEYSNGSECTNSSDKHNSSVVIKREDMEVDIGAITTKMTGLISGDVTDKSPLEPTDIEMELEHSTGFSFDSDMTSDSQTIHSKIVTEYSRSIVNNLKARESVMRGNLSKHEINSNHRKQMVVWMEEVLTIFKCPTDVFFLSVSIMDRYLENSQAKLLLDELHEIGIVSMFIASKYIEVEPLTIELMISKVSHGKLNAKDVIKRENKILAVLKYNLAKPHSYEFIESFTELFSERFGSEEMKTQIMEETIRVAKNGISDRRLAFTVLPSELALCSLIIAIKDCSRSTKCVILDEDFSKAIKNELISDQSAVVQFGKRLRKVAIDKIY